MDNASQQARVESAFVSASSAQHLPLAPTGRRILLRIARIGAGPADTDEVRFQKTLLVASTLLISSAGILWGAIYLYIDEPLAASIPLSYSAASLVSTIIFAVVRRYRLFRFCQLLFILLLPFLLMLALGGFANSSAVVLWSLTAPLGAMVFADRRQALWWFLAYVSLVVGGIAMEGYVHPTNNLPPAVVITFFVMNITAPSVVVFILLHYFVGQKNHAMMLLGKKHRELDEAYNELKTTQAQLIQSEKMASLGRLTAGIAHEIKNPLNFVNNFAEINEELAQELREALAKGENVDDLLADLEQNAQVIAQHGKRADGIVHAMMQHASGGTGQREPTDINALVEEQLNLAYHGKLALMTGFNVTLKRNLDAEAGTVEVVPQEIGRVLLNLLGNAFDAVHEHAVSVNGAYEPTVTVSTRQVEGQLEIRVSDNGPGIPREIREKIFEPFFTTKPTGRGTGLGLSLSYDIVTQGHGGTLTVESTEGEGATFVITLPMNSPSTG